MKDSIIKKYMFITSLVVSIFIFSGLFYYCSNIYQPEKMLGRDIRLFRNTPVWELAKAVNKEDVKKINHLIRNKSVPIDFQEPRFGRTLLIWATHVGREKSVEALLKLGADPNLPDHYRGDNAVMIASDFNYYSDDRCRTTLLKLILEYGGGPNFATFIRRDKTGWRAGGETPLTIASTACLEKVKLLVDAGADINYVNEYGGGNPLKEALLMHKTDIVKYLLIEKKADYRNAEKITNIHGDTITISFQLRLWKFPLNSEDYKIKMEIVEYLKEQGVDYRSSPIPESVLERYPQEYLDKY
jgi:ankyrin repeat protein